jgi:class 3 adenylate cyclase
MLVVSGDREGGDLRRALGWLFGDHWGARSIDGVALPDSPVNRRAIARVAIPAFVGFIGIAVPCVLIVMASGDVDDDTSLPLTIGLVGFTSLVMVPLIWYSFHSFPLWSIHLMALACDGLIVAACFAVGVRWSPLAAALAWVVLGTMIFLIGQTRVAVAQLVPIGASYATVLAVQDGNAAPLARWVAIMGIVTLTGVTVSGLMERTRHFAMQAREARAVAERAQDEIAQLNRTLEARVAAQVDELGRLSGLRRFLAEPVADSLLTDGGTSLLEPHRRQIAVFFCDLRGFTGFASGAEPEEVVDVLDDYYRTVGEVLKRYQATVGTFAGDGVMAYLGDPVPCDEPAAKAVAMALELRPQMVELAALWRRRGQPIGFGMGISYGYATLGMIGFEGRNDYTALGSVVNLAARLCGEAGDGDILLDQRALVSLGDDVPVERVDLTLKGFEGSVAAYRLLAPGT